MDSTIKLESLDPIYAVTAYQEKLYLGQWEWLSLVEELRAKLQKCSQDPITVLEIIYILRILREETDSGLIDALFEVIEENMSLWPEQAGLLIIVDLLDIIVHFKRPEDVQKLADMIEWDLFQVPSHILFLTRKHGWEALWNAIIKQYDLRYTDDNYIRSQFQTTKEIICEIASLGGTLVPLSVRGELSGLREKILNSRRPLIITEGKTDVAILSTAWEKLFPETPIPYMIRDCDPVAESVGGGNGGTKTLVKLISTISSDSPAPVIALFDRDKEGMDALNSLPAYFQSNSAGDLRWIEGGRAMAMLLPLPPGREEYERLNNLCIEFYFGDACLEKKNPGGLGLEFRFPEIETRIKRHGNPLIQTSKSTLLESREITSGKTIFATEIVPNLSTEDFQNFIILFTAIKGNLAMSTLALSEQGAVQISTLPN